MKNAIIAMLMLVTVTSCSFVPEYKQPEVAIPEAWKNGDKGTEAEIAHDWWKLHEPARYERSRRVGQPTATAT